MRRGLISLALGLLTTGALGAVNSSVPLRAPSVATLACAAAPTDAGTIQAAIDAATARGGGLVFIEPGTECDLTAMITISTSNVGVACQGGGGISVAPSVTTGCQLRWVGTGCGTMMSVIAPSGSTTDQPLVGVNVTGLLLDGNNGLACNGVVIGSVRLSRFGDLAFTGLNGGVGLDVDVVHATSTTFDANGCDTQANEFDNLFFRFYSSTSTAVRLGAWLDPSLGNGGCDVSGNTWRNVEMLINNGDGIFFDGGDNERMWNIGIYRLPGGTGNGMMFSVHEDGGMSYPTNSNTVFGLSSNAPVIARGQTTFPSCVAYTLGGPSTCTFGNFIYGLDKGNSSPDPIVEPGAQMAWVTTDGRIVNTNWPTSCGGQSKGALWNNSGVLQIC